MIPNVHLITSTVTTTTSASTTTTPATTTTTTPATTTTTTPAQTTTPAPVPNIGNENIQFDFNLAKYAGHLYFHGYESVLA